MSVSFCWEIVKDTRNTFRHGTSNDIAVLDGVFPSGEISSNEIVRLKAMHMATHLKDSLWSDIADKLERLRGDDYGKEVKIKVWTEF